MTPSLIFDLDGTLVDSLPGIADSLNRALKAKQLPAHSRQAVRSFVGSGLNMLVKRAMPADASETLVEAVIAEFKQDYAYSWAEGTQPYLSIPSILKELQRDGYQLAVLSNKTHVFTQTIAREVFPLIHFTSVLGQQDGVPHKPHPSGALKIANAMGCAPGNCILIGDSAADIETATNAQMPSIAVTWGYNDRAKLERAGAKHFCDSPQMLPRMLRDFAEEMTIGGPYAV